MRRSILLVVASAVLAALAFPPFKTGIIIYFSPILLLFALEELPVRKAFLVGYIWGLVFNLATLHGVFWATIPGAVGMLAVIALIPAITSTIYTAVSRRSRTLSLVAWPLIWVSWDFLRTLSELNFPWSDFGYTHSYYLPMIQPAEILGVYGVSLMIHTVNVLLYGAMISAEKLSYRARGLLLGVAVILPLAFLTYGLIKLPGKIEDGSFRIALAQGNITRDIKWREGGDAYSLETYLGMTRQADSAGVDLVIWPETATPVYLLHEPRLLRQLRDLVDSTQMSLLTGTPQYITVGFREYVYFNAAALISPGTDSLPVYEKIKLVPMSERIPFSGRYKKLREIRLGQADFSSGRKMTVFEADSTRFSVVICFESAFPDYCAEFIRKGAQFLVVITNDMWFGPSTLPYQHARMSVFRAIENRVPVARCANTGVSMFVDRWGHVFGETGMFKKELVIGAINPGSSETIYNRFPDIVPEIALVSLGLVLAVALFRRGKYIS